MANPRTDAIDIGGLVLTPIETICRAFGMKKMGVCKMLRALKVPIGYFGDKGYVCISILAEALLSCMDLGADGFMAPGSNAKKRSLDPNCIPLGADALSDKYLKGPARRVIRGRLDKLRASSMRKNRDLLKSMTASSFQKPPAVPDRVAAHG